MAAVAPREIDVAAVVAALSPAASARIAGIEHFAAIESTNRHLLESAPPTVGRMRVALAEYQHGGRGRRGRRWVMPPGAGIALSASWLFPVVPPELTALSLATGAAARRAIQDAVGIAVGLKWPNDLMLDGGKLGGILVELDRRAAGAWHVVAGIGINVSLPAEVLAGVSDFRHGARDLAGALRAGGLEGSAPPGTTRADAALDRSRLTAALIERLVELFAGFADSGFAPYREEWLAAHVLADRCVQLSSADGVEVGTVRGIDPDGALIVEDPAGSRRRIVSGDVTVREQA